MAASPWLAKRGCDWLLCVLATPTHPRSSHTLHSRLIRIGWRLQVTSPDLQLKYGDGLLMSLPTLQDLTPIDPPTGMSTKNHNEKDDYDKKLWSASCWDEVARACKQKLAPTGSVMVMLGAQQGLDSQQAYDEAKAAFKKAGFRMVSLTWEKYNKESAYNGLCYIHTHKTKGCKEPLLVLSTQTDTICKQGAPA